jgi:hypothetical protein
MSFFGNAAIVLLAICAVQAFAADRKPARGEGSDDSGSITATILDAAQVKTAVGSDFDNQFTVLEVRLEPKSGKPLPVHLDDFFLRSEDTGDHGGPYAASQIGGAGELVVHRANEGVKDKKGHFSGMAGPVFSPGMGAPPPKSGEIDGSRNEVKDDAAPDPTLDQLKQKILAEKTITEPATGLLFFPLEKEKPKNLVLTWTTPSGKVKVVFK